MMIDYTYLNGRAVGTRRNLFVYLYKARGQTTTKERKTTMFINGSTGVLNSSTTFQVLLDLGSEFAIVALDLLVEGSIALVDVVNVSIDVKCTSTREFATLGILLLEIFNHTINSLLTWFVRSVYHGTRRCIILLTSTKINRSTWKCDDLAAV